MTSERKFQEFLSAYVVAPDGFHVLASTDPLRDNMLAVSVVDGVGLGCRFGRVFFPLKPFFTGGGAALDDLRAEVQRLILAMCEYPERFCGGAK